MADVTAYAAEMRQLLPPGHAWRAAPESNLDALLTALAGALARIDARIHDLERERDPRSSAELLPGWERVLGLPEPCEGALAQTLTQRRAAAGAKIASRGGASRQYFIDLAAAHGYTITITEPAPNTWTVHAPSTTHAPRHSGDAYGEPYSQFGTTGLECLIRRYKPAHTAVNFAYGS